MITPSAESIAERRRGLARRTPFGLLAFVSILVSVMVPHVMVVAATIYGGRSLLSVSRFFLSATPGGEGFAGGTSYGAIGFGLSVTYLGLALHQIGAVMGLATFWVLIVEDVGRWVRRFAMAAGVLLTLSSATVVAGYQQLEIARVPTLLGIAWLPTLVAGVTLMIGAKLAKARLSSTWFLERPEIFQP